MTQDNAQVAAALDRPPWRCVCGGESDVLESRRNPHGPTRRRRSCPDCGERWTTYETRDPAQLTRTQLLTKARLLLSAQKVERLAAQIIQQLQSNPDEP